MIATIKRKKYQSKIKFIKLSKFFICTIKSIYNLPIETTCRNIQTIGAKYINCLKFWRPKTYETCNVRYKNSNSIVNLKILNKLKYYIHIYSIL